MNSRPISEDVADLTQQVAEANAALVRGDIDRYLALIEHAKDFTLMSPFGGVPTHGFDTSRRAATEQIFKAGTFDQEVVATYATGDFVVLVTIERVRAEVGGLPVQDWSPRVTQAFRRERVDLRESRARAAPLTPGSFIFATNARPR